MNDKIVLTKRTSSIFLVTLLVLGTIVTILPSAQAQQYYEDRYETEFPQYRDNSYHKSQDSSSVIKKIKCNNINLNNNGVDVSLGVPTDNIIAEAQAEDEGQAVTANGWRDGERNNNNFKFVCTNDNNNINIVEDTIPPDTEQSNLVVDKDVSCELGDNIFTSARACLDLNAGASGAQPRVTPDDFDITVGGNNPTPSQFAGSDIPVIVNLGAGDYQVSEIADPSVATTITNIEENNGVDISQSVIFVGDCDAMTGEGTIAEGEVQVCHIQNVFTATTLPPEDLTASNINTDTSAFDINTAGSLASSFYSPPTIAQGTEEDLTSMEKITKLKQQWLDLLP